MIITTMSDTHGKHKQVFRKKLPGGDVLIHSGDVGAMGTLRDLDLFCRWFESIDNYDTKIFIAGNHDRCIEFDPHLSLKIINSYDINYLQDSSITIDDVKFYGSPWQPEFMNWSFNLPRAGKELKEKWSLIPTDTDVLITHGPPMYILDTSGYPMNEPMLGCVLLAKRVKAVQPKVHIFGHIHGGYGYKSEGGTLFINSSLLNEQYEMVNDPVTIDLDTETNKITFI